MMETRNYELRKAGPDYPSSGLTSKIIACAIEVHKFLGPGFEEVFYQRALHRKLVAAGLDAAREVDIEVRYKDLVLGKKRIDFVVGDCLVEIKAKGKIESVDVVQALLYLKASGCTIGLLINFGEPTVQIKRLVNTQNRGNAEGNGITEI